MEMATFSSYAIETDKSDQAEVGSVQLLDLELEALEVAIDEIGKRLGPVLSQYATIAESVPKPEPASQIRGRIERLAYLRGTLRDITGRIDL